MSAGGSGQDRLLKMAEAVGGQAPAAIPPQLFFSSAAIDVLKGVDPVSGRPIINLSIMAGNGALQVVVPLDQASASVLAGHLSARTDANGGAAADQVRVEGEGSA